jgi:hypothetical protein
VGLRGGFTRVGLFDERAAGTRMGLSAQPVRRIAATAADAVAGMTMRNLAFMTGGTSGKSYLNFRIRKRVRCPGKRTSPYILRQKADISNEVRPFF